MQGDTPMGKTEWAKMEDRFWKKVQKTDGCWLWIGNWKSPSGYGIFGIGKKGYIASRYSYELHKGPIPDGLYVMHGCDNPLCVNPAHLSVGTQKENILDAVKKGRMHGGYKLTADDVRKIRALRGKMMQTEIAKKFGIHVNGVSRIFLKQRWARLDPEFVAGLPGNLKADALKAYEKSKAQEKGE